MSKEIKLKELCAHTLTTPTIFQDEVDKYSRAYWTLASKCTKCGDVFIYDTQFGFYNDLSKESV